ncbi:type III pantothenate kinase [Fodinisporobacter ferrooxydans]|uniref:Type III pantothenate kinase n=1 Tax=Fodinisporobacter ferrooxydans TaxID=2901836 RepID=A0ABY4CMX4_9BACL|nr:type III pantothenate kinase [Alicyclobacillaceae bacterium MYW30-H2]
MILVMDVGNTNITLGVYDGDELLYHWRIATQRERTADEHAVLLQQLFAMGQITFQQIEGIIISSVVPPIMTALELMCLRYFGKKPFVVGPGIKTGLELKNENPKEVGADRIVNAVAAIELYGPPLIVVDFGTATTFCIIDGNGRYVGGIIAPGIKIATEALFQRAAKLPRIDLVKPPHVIGRNTITSMQSGVIYGFAGQVDGLVNRIQNELSLPFTVIATGGLAGVVADESSAIHFIDPLLTLKGLRLIYQKNFTKQ